MILERFLQEETLAATEHWIDPRMMGKCLEAGATDARKRLRHPLKPNFQLALHPRILFDDSLLV